MSYIWLTQDKKKYNNNNKNNKNCLTSKSHKTKNLSLSLPFFCASEWWASLTIAQECEGLVGHFSSAATKAVYYQMCFRYDGGRNYLGCPA